MAEGNGASRTVAQVIRARARLALRAEQAWGTGALSGVELPAPPTAGLAPASAPAPARRAVAGPAAPPAPEARPRRAAPELFASPQVVAPTGDDRPFTNPPPSRQRRIELLAALDESEVQCCSLCPLGAGRTRTVFGEGNPEARLMFIGEGPGENEDQTGRPFVGRAGELLGKMIAGMGLRREDVYIANVVKCRPPNNRVPTSQEVATCTPYLHKQIEWIRPEVIVTLGLPAARHLLRSTLPMGKLRGNWTQWRGIRVMPTYHPAYLLRSYTEANRRIVWGDLQQVMAALGLRRAGAGES